jgi:hypothetical protein
MTHCNNNNNNIQNDNLISDNVNNILSNIIVLFVPTTLDCLNNHNYIYEVAICNHLSYLQWNENVKSAI